MSQTKGKTIPCPECKGGRRRVNLGLYPCVFCNGTRKVKKKQIQPKEATMYPVHAVPTPKNRFYCYYKALCSQCGSLHYYYKLVNWDKPGEYKHLCHKAE